MTVANPPVYQAFNGAQPTTAAIVKVATGTSIKTMLQLATGSSKPIRIMAWGYTMDTAPGGVGTIELIQTDVAATVTAHVASGLVSYNASKTPSSLTLGTAATGYTGSAEGSITATTVFDAVGIGATSALTYTQTFLTDNRPVLPVSSFLRIRATIATTGTNMLCWIKWHE
jgi:hypothetical protein